MITEDEGEGTALELREMLFSEQPDILEGLPTPVDTDQATALSEALECSLSRYNLWSQARGRGILPGPAIAHSVLGVVAEIGQGEGWVLLVGFADGASSMYSSSGGGIIGGEGNASVRTAAAMFCSVAEQCGHLIPAGAAPEPGPGDGFVRFSVLTPSGLRVTRSRDLEPEDYDRPLFPMFEAMHDLITALNGGGEGEGSPSESESECVYINCLLTTLAHNLGASARLVSGGPLPDLAELAGCDEDREWIRSHGFELSAIDSETVLDILIGGTTFGIFRKSKGRLDVQLALGEGQFEPVRFEVRRSKQARGAVECVVKRV